MSSLTDQLGLHPQVVEDATRLVLAVHELSPLAVRDAIASVRGQTAVDELLIFLAAKIDPDAPITSGLEWWLGPRKSPTLRATAPPDPDAPDPRCGSYAGLRVHRRRHEPLCEPCRVAGLAYEKARRERRDEARRLTAAGLPAYAVAARLRVSQRSIVRYLRGRDGGDAA